MNEEEIIGQLGKAPRFGVRHTQALLLFFNIVVAYMSRLNISVALVAMTNAASTNPDFQDFNWPEKHKSYVMSSFYWGFVINQLPGPYLSRRFGTKAVMFICTFGSAVCSLLTPFLVPWRGWQIFCAIRATQGFLQGPLLSAINAHVAKWSTPAERNMIGLLIYSGIDCGIALAVLVSGIVASSPLGWPGISYISAGICFAWCLLWLILSADNPTTSRFITKEECWCIQTSMKRNGDFDKKKIPVPWFAMLTSGSFLALLIVRCSEAWGFSTLQSQTPSYFNGVFDLNIKCNAIFSALPYVARWIMSCTYFFIGNMAVRKGWLTLTAVRKIANSMAFWLPAACLIGIGFLDVANAWAAIALMTLSVGFNGGATIGCLLSTADLSPNHASVVMGVINPVANVIPLITPLVVGVIVKDVHDHSQFQIVFTIAAVILFMGNLIFIIFGSAEVQPWNDADFLLKKNIKTSKVLTKRTFEDNFGYVENEGNYKGCPLENIEHVSSYI